jgi:hypothetical protein
MSGTDESDPLFSVILPVSSIIQVKVAVRLVDQESPTAGDVPAGASVGQLYYNYLDGISTATLSPIGGTALP